MRPIDRLLAVAAGEVPDQVPVDLGFSYKRYPAYIQEWLAEQGIDPGEDPAEKIDARLSFYHELWPEVVPELDRPVGTGPIGLFSLLERRKVEHSDSMPPSLHLDPDEFAARLDDGEVVRDPYADEWMRGAVERWGEYLDHLPADATEEYGGLVWTISSICPLFALGAFMAFEDVFSLLHDDPDLIHRALEFHVDGVVPYIEAVEDQFAAVGVHPPKFQVATEVLPMISPEHDREFLLPYYNRMFDASESPVKVFHCDNHVDHIPDLLADLGADIYRGNFSYYPDLADAVGDDLAIMGNVPPMRVLTYGDADDVRECCEWLIGECAPGGGYILSAGGSFDLSGQTSRENIAAMVETAADAGTYPIDVDPGEPPAAYTGFVDSHFPRSVDRSGTECGTLDSAIAQATCQGKVDVTAARVEDTLAGGADANAVVEQLRHGLAAAESRFWACEYFFPEILLADRAYEAGLAALPELPAGYPHATAVIGAIGNIFESGNILVQAILHAAGFEVVDLGTKVPPSDFLEAAREHDARLVAMGVYMPTNATLAEKVHRSVADEDDMDVVTLAGGVGVGYTPAPPLEVDLEIVDTSTMRERVQQVAAD